MISRVESDNELSCILLHLIDLYIRTALFHIVRIDDNRLMSEILRALDKLLRKLILHKSLKFLAILSANDIPYFGFSVMKKIYRRQIEVFDMPGKHSPIASYIKIGVCYSFKSLLAKTIF